MEFEASDRVFPFEKFYNASVLHIPLGTNEKGMKIVNDPIPDDWGTRGNRSAIHLKLSNIWIEVEKGFGGEPGDLVRISGHYVLENTLQANYTIATPTTLFGFVEVTVEPFEGEEMRFASGGFAGLAVTNHIIEPGRQLIEMSGWFSVEELRFLLEIEAYLHIRFVIEGQERHYSHFKHICCNRWNAPQS